MAESSDCLRLEKEDVSKDKDPNNTGHIDMTTRLNEVRNILKEIKVTNGGTASDNCVYVCIKQYSALLLEHATYYGESVATHWKSSRLCQSGVRTLLLETLTVLLEQGCPANRGSEDETPIMCAVTTRDEDLVKLLMENRADPTLMPPKKLTNALALAVILNDVTILKLILSSKVKANINAPCCERLTAIQLAMNKSEEISNLLVQNGADKRLVMQVNVDEHSFELLDPPLIEAAKTDTLYLAAVLLEHGENVNQSHGSQLNAPIHCAVGAGSQRMIHLLMQYGANIDKRNGKGYTPLGMSLHNDYGEETAKLLLDSGCSWKKDSKINSYQYRYPPLHIAAFLGFDYHLDIIKLILEKASLSEEKIYKVCQKGKTVGACTVSHKHKQDPFPTDTEIDGLNLADQSFIDTQSFTDKSTALFMSVYGGNLQIAKYLYNRGANPYIVGYQGSLLHAAVMATKFSREMLMFALQFGLPVNEMNAEGNTPLVLAARNRDQEVCQLLLEHGAFMDVPDRRFGETAVSISVYFGFELNAEVLLCHGACPDIPDERDTTALYWAIFNCRERALRLLLDSGAKLTPSGLASFPRNLKLMRNEEIKRLLRDRVTNPASLQHCCRLAIRGSIKKALCGPSIIPAILSLPLPHKLKEYLVLRPAFAVRRKADED